MEKSKYLRLFVSQVWEEWSIMDRLGQASTVLETVLQYVCMPVLVLPIILAALVVRGKQH